MDLLDLLTAPDDRRPMSVSDLTGRIRHRLEDEFADVQVRGELSNFKKHTSGHWYFTLKDERAQVRAACFRNANMRVRFRPEDGMEVTVRGRISVYEPRGDFQLIAESMEPVGIGSLQLAFEQLKARLAAEGLFDPTHKKPIPLLPRTVGIVTSPTGAAIRDILRVLGRRNRTVNVVLYPAAVEGEAAAKEIAAGIAYFNDRFPIEHDRTVDVLIVGRGGGSAESLWAFNTEPVARAIYASTIPVISAVGHEIDVTIADFVADLRAPTPSAAAEMVAVHRDELARRVERAGRFLERHIDYRLLHLRSRLRELIGSQAFADVRARLRDTRQRADELLSRLESAARDRLRTAGERGRSAADILVRHDWRRRLQLHAHQLDRARERMIGSMGTILDARRGELEQNVGKLDAMSPLRVLDRGYALARRADGTLVRQTSDVVAGEKLTLRVRDGDIACEVLEIPDQSKLE